MASRVAGLCAAAALALAAWAALDPAHGGIATLLAAFAVLAAGFAWLEGGHGVRARPDARRHARRPCRRGTCPLRPDPERPARDGHRRRSRSRARPAPRVRGRRPRGDRVELLPRPGPPHALADAGVGRLRPPRRPAAAVPAPATRVRRLRVRARLCVRDADGHLALVRLLPAYARRRCSRDSPRASPSTSPTRPGTSCSRSSPGRS